MIGEILKRTRLIYGYKASVLSKKLEISSSYISEIENNKKKPPLDLLEKYAAVFDMKVSTLILLSEDHDDAVRKNRTEDFVKKMMIKFIELMSKNEVDPDGQDDKKVSL